VGAESDWRALAVGRFCSCAVRARGLSCWGDNRQGQLGLGDLMDRDVPTFVPLP
jgi:hypothetical protein